MFHDKQILNKIATMKPTNWITLKTEGIDFTSDFYWINDYPFCSEIKVFEKKNCSNRLIVADLNNNAELKRIKKIMQNAIKTNVSS